MDTRLLKKIHPSDLTGARTYFTGFDNKSYLSKNEEDRTVVLNRTLKVLLLTKNQIVFGASHLKSNMAFKLAEENPEVFSKGYVIPALNTGHDGYLGKAVGSHFPKEKMEVYNDVFDRCVEWDLHENTSWFREKILQGFAFKNSLLLNNMTHTNPKNISKIINLIGDTDLVNREYTKKIELLIDDRDMIPYKRYKNLIYNVSGARSVNCESALDQENMIFDYSLEDLGSQRTVLSEVEIFNRIFIERVFSTLDRVTPNTKLIDQLSYADVFELRNIIDNSKFISKYNKLVDLSSEIISQKDHIDFYSLNELVEIADNIHSSFKLEIENEFISFVKKENRSNQSGIFIESGYGVIKSLSSIANPIASTAFSTVDLGINSVHFIKNLYNIIRSKEDSDALDLYGKQKNQSLKKLLDKSSIDERTAMIDTIKLVQSYISEKQRI